MHDTTRKDLKERFRKSLAAALADFEALTIGPQQLPAVQELHLDTIGRRLADAQTWLDHYRQLLYPRKRP